MRVVTRTTKKRRAPVTLAIDIGGTGIKALLLDSKGNALTDRLRVLTPKPATPKRVTGAIFKLVRGIGDYDRVSIGFPGVVIDDEPRTAPNLDGRWKNLPLARVLSLKLGRPVRVLNDAGIQGYGVIEGKGTEMVITLGTGMG
ncbi:MAG: Polyphosphate glucokinase, partial [Labilithrix sp.]|nr:Polyphosphate glucokinase [Labilithrix sp.]